MWKFASLLAIAGLFVMSQAVSAEDQAAEKPAAKTAGGVELQGSIAGGQRGRSGPVPGQGRAGGERRQQVRADAAVQGVGSPLPEVQRPGTRDPRLPCNQFNGQEPGTAEEIRKFCTANYNVTFPLMAKVEVNGAGACDLYKHLKALDAKPKGPGEITWNFEKFVIGRNGQVVARFQPADDSRRGRGHGRDRKRTGKEVKC